MKHLKNGINGRGRHKKAFICGNWLASLTSRQIYKVTPPLKQKYPLDLIIKIAQDLFLTTPTKSLCQGVIPSLQ